MSAARGAGSGSNRRLGERGVQLGALVNYLGEGRSVQLGLINVAKNGFLPFFPLVNLSLSTRRGYASQGVG
jgi:hypothetical protein